jgi:hypothetical protein
MKTWKVIVVMLVAFDIGSSPLAMADCQDKAASTSFGPFCDSLCTQECAGEWTLNTPLWCTNSPGFNCDTYNYNPPVNINVRYSSGTCQYVGDSCVCRVDLSWLDPQVTFWYQGTSKCGP